MMNKSRTDEEVGITVIQALLLAAPEPAAIRHITGMYFDLIDAEPEKAGDLRFQYDYYGCVIGVAMKGLLNLGLLTEEDARGIVNLLERKVPKDVAS